MNINCTGSSVNASSSGDCSLTNARFAFDEQALPPILPIDRLEDHLAFHGAVEDERRGGAMRARTPEHCARSRRRQQAPHHRLTVTRLDDGAVAQNERQRRRKPLEDRSRKLVATAGRDRHFNASSNRASDRATVCVGNVALAVEDGSVEVEGE